MEGFNDVWANILLDNIIDQKEALNVTVFDAPSMTDTVKLNLESHIVSESSVSDLLPRVVKKKTGIMREEEIRTKKL